MPVVRPRIRANILQGLDPLLRARSGPPLIKLLTEVGIPPSAVNDDHADIALGQYARLLDRASRKISDECFGLWAARAYPVGASGVLGYLLRHAPDLRTFIECLTRYSQLQVDALSLEFEEAQGIARITLVLPDSVLPPRRPVIEFMLSVVVLRIRNITGQDWLASKAEFEYRQPSCLAEYHELFGRCLKFDAGVNRLTLRAEALARSNASADSLLFRTLQVVAEDQLRAIARSREGLKGAAGRDLLRRLDDYITANLDSGRINLESTAEVMGFSVRDLQAELRRRDTSLGHELSRIRHGLAARYLTETNLPMSEIAFLLGFSELSAFTRASKGWFGKPPTAVRQEQEQA